MCCPIGCTELLCCPIGIQVKVKMVKRVHTEIFLIFSHTSSCAEYMLVLGPKSVAMLENTLLSLNSRVWLMCGSYSLHTSGYNKAWRHSEKSWALEGSNGKSVHKQHFSIFFFNFE